MNSFRELLRFPLSQSSPFILLLRVLQPRAPRAARAKLTNSTPTKRNSAPSSHVYAFLQIFLPLLHIFIWCHFFPLLLQILPQTFAFPFIFIFFLFLLLGISPAFPHFRRSTGVSRSQFPLAFPKFLLPTKRFLLAWISGQILEGQERIGYVRNEKSGSSKCKVEFRFLGHYYCLNIFSCFFDNNQIRVRYSSWEFDYKLLNLI